MAPFMEDLKNELDVELDIKRLSQDDGSLCCSRVGVKIDSNSVA